MSKELSVSGIGQYRPNATSAADYKQGARTEVIAVLVGAKSLISTPETWTQGFYARTPDGHEVFEDNPWASQFCAIGAICKAGRRGSDEAKKASRLLRSCLPNPSDNISAFNDSATHEEVLQAFDCAIAKAIGGAEQASEAVKVEPSCPKENPRSEDGS